MAQAGIHALIGAATRRILPKQEWLMLGILLGSLFPDADNYTVAIATVAGLDTHNLHRTFTHSILAIVVVTAIFLIISQVSRQRRWAFLGIGLGIGISLHIVFDLLIWFNGVELLWPLGGWINLWDRVKPPVWFAKLLDPAEFLFFALYFWWLIKIAKDRKTDSNIGRALPYWMIATLLLVVIFTPLSYLMSKGYQTIFGVFYLVTLTAAIVITIQMRQSIELFGAPRAPIAINEKV